MTCKPIIARSSDEARILLGREICDKPERTGLADYFRRTMVNPGPDYEGSVAVIRRIRDEE